MRMCKLCRQSHERDSDVWQCLWCPSEVCDRCYSDHVSTHEAEHSPEIARKRKTEQCLALCKTDPDLRCRKPWGHADGMHSDPQWELDWPREPDDRWHT